ncbi:MAG: hypothetical protein GX335_00685 [Firmicutes bacterium]|nr:hypothetical protein [Bacillota bacterium]
MQKERLAGGVCVQAHNWEGGLGGLIFNHGRHFGLTGYMQYSLGLLQNRLQLDLLSNKEWQPQFALGVPIRIKDTKLEPHLLWRIEREPKKPKLGFKVQFVF